MSKNHRWISGTCVKCGLMRTQKTKKILMAIVNHPPFDVYKYEQYFEYSDGIKKMEKRPDCKTNNRIT